MKNKFETSLVDVTPSMASKWLAENNTNNRNLRQGHVIRLASDMAEGRWYQTHQGIAFNGNGTLLDGQHRLEAIVLADITVPLLVTTGLAAEAMSAVDDHQRRTVGDALTIGHGMPTSARLTSAAEWVRCGAGAYRGKCSKQEKVQFFLDHQVAIRWTLNILTTPKGKGIGRAPVLGAVARAYYTVDHHVLERFCNVLESGIPEAAHESVVIKLRDFLISGNGSAGGWSGGSETYKKTARALVAFINRETLSTLREVSEEPFPLPNQQLPVSSMRRSPGRPRKDVKVAA